MELGAVCQSSRDRRCLWRRPAGIGSAFGDIGKFGHEVLRGLAHGFSNGGISELTGGSFLQGFASGALGSLAGSGFQAWGGDFAKSAVGTVGFSAVAGGIGAELTGGEFWKGAVIGATVAGLNHVVERNQANYFEKKHGVIRDSDRNVIEINGTRVIGSSLTSEGSAFTAPGIGIIVHPSAQKDIQLLMHEYGHILQLKLVGYEKYYTVIAPSSVKSFMSNFAQHFSYWSEVNANMLAFKHFEGGGTYKWNFKRYPVK